MDVLVELDREHIPGPITFAGYELSEILGRKVDLNTADSLSRYYRDGVLAEARDEYVARP